MEIIRNKNYRLTTITLLTTSGFTDQPISYGLEIGKRCPDGESWYVIATVKPDKDGICEIASIGERLLDVEDDEWKIFKSLVTAACFVIRAAQEGKD